ncbi:hypothetical protein OSTOST_09617 [Ostertagia ostertagi]
MSTSLVWRPRCEFQLEEVGRMRCLKRIHHHHPSAVGGPLAVQLHFDVHHRRRQVC